MSQANLNGAVVQETSNERSVIANALHIVYEEFGDASNPTILLIMGLGRQMIAWPDDFCQGLADQGFRIIRFDNRDIGLSEKIDVSPPVSIPKLMLRKRLRWPIKVPYSLNDMALDAIGLLDALKIAQAHIVGVSMGGMIAQIIAADHSHRCTSLISVMSSSGNPSLPTAAWRINKLLINRPTSGNTAEVLAHTIKLRLAIGSPDYPPSNEYLKKRILKETQRSDYPIGFKHHLAAIIDNGDRRKLLKTITAPTLVIHGKGDSLVPADAGIDTAKNIAGAELKLIEGMGHDLPMELLPKLVRLIGEHTHSCESSLNKS